MVTFDLFGKYKPLYIDNEIVYAYKAHRIYSCNFLKDKIFSEICKLPIVFKLRLFSKIRYLERLFRIEPRAAYLSIDRKLIISYLGSVYAIDLQKQNWQKEHTFRKNMNNPLSFGEIKNISGFRDCLVYGEYWGNTEKKSVAIYGRNLNSNNWNKLFEFPENTITHIHSIVADKFKNRVLILTGDEDKESGIWVAEDNFQKVEPLIIGKQAFRSCALFPTEQGLLFATDTPHEENYIGLIDESEDELKISKVYYLEGPCINYFQNSNVYGFATSVEPDSSIKGVKYFLTSQLGKGIKSRFSTLIIGNLISGFNEVLRLKKDFLPLALFQFGNIWFPAGSNSSKIIIYPQSVKKYDGNMLVIEIGREL
jgi:hypothetical protein